MKNLTNFTLQPFSPRNFPLHYEKHILITSHALSHTHLPSTPTPTPSFLPHQASLHNLLGQHQHKTSTIDPPLPPPPPPPLPPPSDRPPQNMMDAVTTISSCVQRLDDCYPSITTKDVDMPHPSLWTSAWWQDALALQSILEADPSRAQQLCAEVADTELSPWLNVLETSNDDQLWWSSAWLTCYELTGRSSFLQRSEFLFSHTYQSWNASYCGGGETGVITTRSAAVTTTYAPVLAP